MGSPYDKRKMLTMESEFVQRLQHAHRDQLILLLQELATRHPALLTEIEEMLSLKESDLSEDVEPEEDVEATEDWDFSGNEVTPLRSPQPPILLPLDREAYQQRIDSYMERLNQGESAQAIVDDITELLEEAETRAEHHDYHGALNLYALVLDERIAERGTTLNLIFDTVIDDVMPILETLLSEASSNITFDPTVTLSPVLTPDMRHQWLQRLFTLWLQRLDVRHTEENIPEMILNIAWSEDIPFLHTLVQAELQHQPWSGHSNIVDFTRQYRVRTLEKFLKELPQF